MRAGLSTTFAHAPARQLALAALLAVAAGAATAGLADGAAAGAAARPAAGGTAPITTTTAGHRGVQRGHDDAALAFTACMRSHGVPDFPGVTISPDGRVHIDPAGGEVDPLSARFAAAVQACKRLLPDDGGGLPRPPAPLPVLRAPAPRGMSSCPTPSVPATAPAQPR